MRLIFVFRNPVARTMSDYWYHLHRGDIPARPGPEKVLLDRDHWVHDANAYSDNLVRWRAAFGQDTILTLLSEDLRDDPAAALGRVADFLGVVPVAPAGAPTRDNRTIYPRSMALLRWGDWGTQRGRGRPWHGPGLALRNRLFFGGARPPVPAAVTRGLADLYRDEIATFGALIGRDLSHWLAPA